MFSILSRFAFGKNKRGNTTRKTVTTILNSKSNDNQDINNFFSSASKKCSTGFPTERLSYSPVFFITSPTDRHESTATHNTYPSTSHYLSKHVKVLYAHCHFRETLKQPPLHEHRPTRPRRAPALVFFPLSPKHHRPFV